MLLELTPEQLAIQEMARDFAQNKLEPYAGLWDKEKFFPIEVLKEAASLGMGGMFVSPELGGAGLTRFDAALIFEQLAIGCISTSAYLSIHNMALNIIDKYADEDLRKLWVPKLSSMESLASYCLTEPDAGSDAASLKTTAVLQGDYYVVNGAKAFISGAGVSDVYICMVRTKDIGHKGISCLLIEKDTKGLSFGKSENKMGWCSQPTAMIYFEDCKVPTKSLIGEEGMGFKIALSALNGGRVNIAACSLGGALACIDKTRKYLQERQQFKKYLSEFQALRFKFADMLTDYESARLMVLRAAAALDMKHDKIIEYCAMAKKVATEKAFEISDNALQLHGGYGYLHDYGIERIFRDLRVHRILEGTNEIMQEIISKDAFNEN